MKISTFYNIYYKHRFIKAKFYLKIYLLFIFPIKYLIYIIFSEKKLNLENLEISNPNLFNFGYSKFIIY